MVAVVEIDGVRGRYTTSQMSAAVEPARPVVPMTRRRPSTLE